MRFSPSLPLPRAARRAFTLLEIMVALAILGLLVALAVTNLGTIFGGAQVSTAQLFVQQTMKTPLTAYRIATGTYPTTAEGLQALVVIPAGKEGKLAAPLMEKLPLDPWGQPYQYAYPGTHNKNGYDLWSKGPPDKPMEIGNWDSPATGADAPK